MHIRVVGTYPKNPVSAPAVGSPLCSGDKHRLFRLRTHMHMGGGGGGGRLGVAIPTFI